MKNSILDVCWNLTGILSTIYSILATIFSQSTLNMVTAIASCIWVCLRIYREVFEIKSQNKDNG